MNILVLCTGNSVRSILLEAILNRLGGDHINARSAGSNPTGRVNPYAATLLLDLGYDVRDLRSKCWDAFATTRAPEIDLVITVCDAAAAQDCPLFPGHAARIHWGIPDPAAVTGNDATINAAFRRSYDTLLAYATEFMALDHHNQNAQELAKAANRIGQDRAA